MSSSSSSSSDSEMSDYDSSASLDVFVNRKKFKKELKKEIEKEKKVAAEQGLPTYMDGTRKQFDEKGRVRNMQHVRLERKNRKHHLMKVQVMKNITRHLRRPSVRQAYNFFTQNITPDPDLFSGPYNKKVRVTADEDTIEVIVIHSPSQPD